MEKPFSFNYLKSQILSLLSNRRKEREAFSKRPFFPVHNMQMNKADEEFMNKVINVIQENISDENFNVERMADILCMSRSSLLRKIKILFNLSPIDFIRLIRLKKAAELIQEGKYRIGDICYMVGINSSSYFIAEVEKNTFDVVSDMMPDGTRMATLHLSISDATGDNAIFEYVDGKLDIHHSKAYQVMTNSPVFDQQLALDDYWKNIGGTTFLPGTNRAADRFVRASFYINAIPKTEDTRTALASVFSVIRNTSVPFGISTPDQPNISSTRWRTVSDQKDKVYYFESTLYPNVFWIDFKDVDFSEKAPVKKLNLLSGKTYAGNTAKEFVATKPFQFLGIK